MCIRDRSTTQPFIDGGDCRVSDQFTNLVSEGRGAPFNLGCFKEVTTGLVENHATKPVKGATLIGDAKEVMPRISMCANDLELAAGFCGSVSGSVFVTVGQPHIKVDSITVGGR